MNDQLGKYRAKRDFKITPEPEGEAVGEGRKRPRFVVHEHHASHLHWDFRLEHDGVLVSWAVPKGIPLDPKTNHLAVHVEDHPLGYIDFAGRIPEGEYGAGEVIIWDRGTYESHKFKDKEVIITLLGERVSGKYVLFQTRGKNWIIHRMDSPLEERQSLPQKLVPMLAKLSKLPADDSKFAFEIKWDGIRAVLYCEGGRVRLETRNLRDITLQYPELHKLGEALGSREVVLDGEIIAPLEDGRPSFERLQGRLGLNSESAVRRKMKEIPIVYMIFDLLFLDGRSIMDLPYTERRRLLEELALAGSSWQTPAYHVGDGPAMVEAGRVQGLEGVIAKKLGSRYEPGKRSGAWLKIKNHLRQELVIGGWTPGEGGRAGHIGALLVGYYDVTPDEATRRGAGQRLLYAGSVGTGFTESALVDLARRLASLRRDTSPFTAEDPRRSAVFAEPVLVGEFEFSEWTRDHILRQPSFKGLRDDKDPREVIREEV